MLKPVYFSDEDQTTHFNRFCFFGPLLQSTNWGRIDLRVSKPSKFSPNGCPRGKPGCH